MSLVIASNYQDEYSGQLEQDRAHKINQGTPMQKSSFFSNHLKNPMIIPPHSEVAVQSVKINRLPVFDIMAGNRFHLYWGRALEDKDGTPLYDMNDTFSTPIPCTIKPGTYTQDQMRDEIQKELKRALGHPTWFDKVVLTDVKGTAGEWNGFKIDFQCNEKAGATDYGEKLTDWVNFVPETAIAPAVGEYSAVHDAGGHTTTLKRLKATAPFGSRQCTIVCRSAPNDLTSGEMEIDLFDKFGKTQNAVGGAGNPPAGDAYRHNACGFFYSRERRGVGTTTPDWGNPFLTQEQAEMSLLPTAEGCAFENDLVSYGDYRIDWNKKLDGSGYALQLSHGVWDAESNGVVMKPIEYWKGLPAGDNGSSNPVTSEIKEADLIDNTTNPGGAGDVGWIGKFKIAFKGSGMKLWMIYWTKAAGEVYKIICDTTLSDNRVNHDKVWAPITQNKWAMYPGWNAATLNHDSVFTKNRWSQASTTNGWTYGTSAKVGSSWWAQCLQDKQGGGSADSLLQLARAVESRENNQAKAGTTIHWADLTADTDAPQMSKALVVNSPETTIDTGKGIYYPARGANMGAILGFPDWHAVASVQLGTNKNFADAAKTDPTAKWEISSLKKPEYSVHDAFIKVPSLTCQSFNFCKSIPSQILYHIPRWSDNKEYGCLFHEATEKTYIALRNPDKIQCNQLDFQIVDKNEQIVKDLTGNTTIVLHIRSARM